MNLKSAAAVLGAALVIAAAPAIGSAQTTQSGPIQLDNVEIAQSYGDVTGFAPGLVSVAFKNVGDATATDVVFDLIGHNGEIIAQYRDAGSFPQGATVRRDFSDTHIENDQQLQVGQVTFADGTTWSASSRSAKPASIFPAE
jgi:hypothetical protein